MNSNHTATTTNNNNKYSVKKSNIGNQYKRISLEQLAQSNDGVYNNARYMNICLILMGCPVNLRCKSGDTFHGIFTTFSPDFEVVLECCHKVDSSNEVVICGRSLPSKNNVKTLIFPKEDIVEIVAVDVDKEFAITSAEAGFTDSAIAQKLNGLKDQGEDSKALEPFVFEGIEDSSETALDNNRGWSVDDMLTLNEARYGYKSTYNSDLTEYTVPVEKEDTDEYRRREEEAERMALEIESSSTYRNNVDKELSDNEEEEAAFSAVDRSTQDLDDDSYNSYNNSKEKFINTNYKRNKAFEQRNKQRNSSSSNQNSSNSSLNNNGNSSNSYKRYPSSGNNNNNLNSQSRLSFERTNSNIESPSSSLNHNRQFYAPNSNNNIADSQVYHNNRRTKLNNTNNNNEFSRNNNGGKSYKNLHHQQHKMPAQVTVVNNQNEQQQYSNESISNLSESQLDASKAGSSENTNEESVNNAKKPPVKAVKPSSPTKNDPGNGLETLNSTERSDSSAEVENKIKDQVAADNTASNMDESSSSETPKSKLNPFAQEFSPINLVRSQVVSPVNANVYVPINHTLNQNIPAAQLQPTPIYMNQNSQPYYFVNQPYTQPAYITSPTPVVPQPQQPVQSKPSKKGSNEAPVPTMNPGMTTALPPPPQAQQNYQPRAPYAVNQVPQSQMNNPTQVVYTAQPPMNYTNPNAQQMGMRYMNPQFISYQPNPNEFQNQQPVYYQNGGGQVVYNTTMVPAQPNVQITQTAELAYAPSATTPNRTVNQSAPHTPSPLPQHPATNAQQQPQQYQPSLAPQNYAQTFYFIPPGQAPNMQQGQIAYTTVPGHPMNQQMAPNQQYVFINPPPYQQQQQLPPHQQQPQQQNNKVYFIPQQQTTQQQYMH